jgi:peptidoglycan-N-acetylglucosamine deacetylase
VTRAPSAPRRRPRTPRVFAALLVLVAVLGSASSLAGQPATVVSRGDGSQRTIALTFDDGWDASRCEEIAGILDTYGVTATWFPNAVYVASHHAAWRRIAARFPIGNHTTHHLDLRTLSDKEMRHEIVGDRELIERITGKPMAPLLRPPFGATDDRVLRIAREVGFPTAVLWDTTSADTATHSTAWGIARAAIRGGPGSIVLMHCGPEVTPEILPAVISHYACDGYRFATVEQLLAGDPGQSARVECPGTSMPKRTKHHRGSSTEPTDMPGPATTPEPGSGPSGTWPAIDPFALIVAWVERQLSSTGGDAPG